MHWLTKYINKIEVICMHTVITIATLILFNNNPYSSSKFSANWRATATHVKGWLLNNVALTWNAYH